MDNRPLDYKILTEFGFEQVWQETDHLIWEKGEFTVWQDSIPAEFQTVLYQSENGPVELKVVQQLLDVYYKEPGRNCRNNDLMPALQSGPGKNGATITHLLVCTRTV